MNSLNGVALSTLTEYLMDTTALSAIVVVIFAYLLFYVFIPRFRMDYYLADLPTMKGSLPILGHALLLLGPAPWTKMAQWSLYPNKNVPQVNSSEDGERSTKPCRLVYLNIAGTRIVYLNHPSLIKRVLLTNQRNYEKALDEAYKHFMCLLGTGLVTAEGEQWKTGRLLLSRVMRVDILEEIPEMTIRAMMNVMDKLESLDPSRPYVDLSEEFRHMTLRVIGESCLSLTHEETDRIFPTLYLPIMDECNKRVWAPWRAYLPFLRGFRERRRCLRALNNCLCDLIRERWRRREAGTAEGPPDLLDLCLAQLGPPTEAHVRRLRDDVKTILLAGHETSAAMLTWATYEVLRDPALRARLVTEAQDLFDPDGCPRVISMPFGRCGIPPPSRLAGLVVAPAILRETLRRHSVVPIVVRRAVRGDILPAAEAGLPRDVHLPAGVLVGVGIAAVHNHPEVWDQPERFDPDRFINAEIANDTNRLQGGARHDLVKKIDPYGFIPFINGPRNCLGQHFAMVEAQVALAFLFLRWDLMLYRAPGEGTTEDPEWQAEVGRHHDYVIPQVPHHGLKVTGAPRS